MRSSFVLLRKYYVESFVHKFEALFEKSSVESHKDETS